MYETVITAKSSGKVNIREILKYKDLIWLFVKRDFVTKYKQTILGPLWAIIQPLINTIVFNIVFGNLARLTTADTINTGGSAAGNMSEAVQIPGFLFYMVGTVFWSYFAQTITTTAKTFLNNYRVMGKVYFPRIIMPISGALSNLISFGIRFVMFLIFWAYYFIRGDLGIHLSWAIILLPLLLLQMILMAIGFGLLITSVTTKYRDMIHMLDFTIQMWQYLTPVAYGLSLVPEKFWGIYMLNPMTMVIVIVRYAFFGVGYFNAGYYAMSWGVTLLALFAGSKLFYRVERTFVDTI